MENIDDYVPGTAYVRIPESVLVINIISKIF